ncbi:ComEC/Rec2 family competence protein [Algoriphagus halophilus]|uniref:Metal-dependent hydrolase, beta-lactamase superfamily II n=1 Tax=Algoriphagus halophilus TaxID=226505 RepID=A0A1N6D3M4_9BACT|nr:MBL fold metallo-hydrolase [Algoriphagus halophilus]SIN65398.1 Metal-dependent hydrolase, beta-lactamase superfamily II [Algoriphagus halophilus]
MIFHHFKKNKDSIFFLFFLALLPQDNFAQLLKVKTDRTAIVKSEPSRNGILNERLAPVADIFKLTKEAPNYYSYDRDSITGWSYKLPTKESLRSRRDVLQIEVIDVEVGDATLIVCPEENGKRDVILIDCGMGNDAERIREAIASFGFNLNAQPITSFIATHYDHDHVGAIKDIVPLSQKIYDPGSKQQTSKYKTALKNRESDREEMQLNYIEQFSGGVTIECVAVNNATDNEPNLAIARDKNQNSIALIVSYKGFDYFTAGDLTLQPESSLASNIKNSDVYHVNHHGSSRTSSGLDFVRNLDPEVSVVSNGTQHGHPNVDIGKRLTEEVGSMFFQTNINPASNAFQNELKFVADTTHLSSRKENQEGATGSIRIIVDPFTDKYYVVMQGLELSESTFPIEH